MLEKRTGSLTIWANDYLCLFCKRFRPFSLPRSLSLSLSFYLSLSLYLSPSLCSLSQIWNLLYAFLLLTKTAFLFRERDKCCHQTSIYVHRTICILHMHVRGNTPSIFPTQPNGAPYNNIVRIGGRDYVVHNRLCMRVRVCVICPQGGYLCLVTFVILQNPQSFIAVCVSMNNTVFVFSQIMLGFWKAKTKSAKMWMSIHIHDIAVIDVLVHTLPKYRLQFIDVLSMRAAVIQKPPFGSVQFIWLLLSCFSALQRQHMLPEWGLFHFMPFVFSV